MSFVTERRWYRRMFLKQDTKESIRSVVPLRRLQVDLIDTETAEAAKNESDSESGRRRSSRGLYWRRRDRQAVDSVSYDLFVQSSSDFFIC